MQSQESPVAVLTFGWIVVGFLRDFLRLPLSTQIEILTLRHLSSAAARKSPRSPGEGRDRLPDRCSTWIRCRRARFSRTSARRDLMTDAAVLRSSVIIYMRLKDRGCNIKWSKADGFCRRDTPKRTVYEPLSASAQVPRLRRAPLGCRSPSRNHRALLPIQRLDLSPGVALDR
jgi:hypothetical protein